MSTSKKLKILNPDLHFKLLKTIESKPSISQRELAKELGVSLGSINYCLKALRDLRKAGINAELYPDTTKMKKQMTYANKKGIPYVVLVGEDEMNSGLLTVKNMNDGTQSNVSVIDLIKQLNA